MLLGRVVHKWIQQIIESEDDNFILRLFVEGISEEDAIEIFSFLHEVKDSFNYDFILPKRSVFENVAVLEPYATTKTGVSLRNSIVDTHTICLLDSELDKTSKDSLRMLKLTNVSLYSKELFEQWIQATLDEKNSELEVEHFELNFKDYFRSLLQILFHKDQHFIKRLSNIKQYLQVFLSHWNGSADNFWTVAAKHLNELGIASHAIDFKTVLEKKGTQGEKIKKIVKELNTHEQELYFFIQKKQPSKSRDAKDYKKEDLHKNLNKLVKSQELSIESNTYKVLDHFIASNFSYQHQSHSASQQEFLSLNWRTAKKIFELPKQKKSTLGEETQNFLQSSGYLDKEEPLSESLLKIDDRSSLKNKDEIKDWFYDNKELFNSKLLQRWTKILNKDNKTYSDLQEAILLSSSSLLQSISTEEYRSLKNPKFVLYIDSNKAYDDFWSEKNRHMAEYVYLRYVALDEANSPIQFYFHNLELCLAEYSDENNKTRDEIFIKKSKIGNKIANALRFKLLLVDEKDAKILTSNSYIKQHKKILKNSSSINFDYQFEFLSILSGFSSDIRALSSWEENGRIPLFSGQVKQNLVSNKGIVQGFDLYDKTTFFDQLTRRNLSSQAGRLLLNKPSKNTEIKNLYFINQNYQTVLDGYKHQNIEKIKETYQFFYQSYSTFFISWAKSLDGKEFDTANNVALLKLVSDAYLELLEVLQEAASVTDKQELWKPIFDIGVFFIERLDSQRSVIISPLNPMRLQEIYIKLSQRNKILRTGLQNAENILGQEYYFTARNEHMKQSYYPSIFYAGKFNSIPAIPKYFMQNTQSLQDYSFMQSMQMMSSRGLSIKDFSGVAISLEKVLNEYIELSQHQSDYLNIGIYEPGSEKLIEAVLDRVEKGLLRKNKEVHINFVVIASRRKMQELYQSTLNFSQSSIFTLFDENGTNRISVKFLEPIEAKQLNLDITFVHNIFSEQGKLDWKEAKRDIRLGLADDEIFPYSYSLTIPFNAHAGQVSSYKTHKFQSKMGTLHSDMIGDITDPNCYDKDKAKRQRAYLLNVGISGENNPLTEQLEKIRNMSDWIVSYDVIADQRVFEYHGFDIIRHFTEGSNNIVVATTRDPLLMKRLLQKRLDTIYKIATTSNIFFNKQIFDDISKMVTCIQAESQRISGRMVMRASKRGKSASELLGTVAAMHRVRQFLGTFPKKEGGNLVDLNIAWLSLDDYKSRFGAEKGVIADLMVISPEMGTSGFKKEDGQYIINIVLSESKAMNVYNKGLVKKSLDQTRQTFAKFERALRENSLSRMLYIQNLADLYQENVEESKESREIYQALIDNNVSFRLFGFSHVTVYGENKESNFKIVEDGKSIVLDVIGIDYLQKMLSNIYYDFREDDRFCEEVQNKRLSLLSDSNFVADLINIASKLEAISVEEQDERLENPKLMDLDSDSSDVVEKKKEESSEDSDEVDSTVVTSSNPLEGLGLTLIEDESESDSEDIVFELKESDIASQEPLYQEDNEEEHSVKEEQVVVEPLLGDEESQASLPEDSNEEEDVEDSNELLSWLKDVSKRTKVANEESDTEWLKTTTVRLHEALKNEEMEGILKKNSLTPIAARIVYQGNSKLTVANIEKKYSYFRSTYALDILQVEALLGEVVFYIKRPNRKFIDLPSKLVQAFTERGNTVENRKLLIAESEVDGSNVYLDTSHSPHSLVAGSSGSGKGVLLQNLLLDICASNSPNRAHIWLIDPKLGPDYNYWVNYLPHFQKWNPENASVVISKQEEAIALFEWLVEETERRYEKLSSSWDLDAKLSDPYIWVVHDELENWTGDKEYFDMVGENINKLAAKARAAGIYLLFATQRPSNETMGMRTRNNLGNRLILRVSDHKNSKIALGDDTGRADQLAAKGHILCKLDAPDLIRGQVPYLSKKDAQDLAKEIAKFWRKE